MLDAEALTLLETASAQLRLSTRGQVRALRVARSIADLGGAARIARAHVAEALAFRHRVPARG
jgi:magnesium chelatase family protein